MIKQKEAKVKSMRTEDVDKNKLDIELIKHDIKSIREETNIHNKQTEKDFASIHKKIDKIDNRLWWIAGVIIVATLGPLIGQMFM
jgi:hypothetical protein